MKHLYDLQEYTSSTLRPVVTNEEKTFGTRHHMHNQKVQILNETDV
jgi:hypothetical protein